MPKLYQHQQDGTYYTRLYWPGVSAIVTRQIHPDGVRLLKQRGVRLEGEIPLWLIDELKERNWLATKEEMPFWGIVDWAPHWHLIDAPDQLKPKPFPKENPFVTRKREQKRAAAEAKKRAAEEAERQREEAKREARREQQRQYRARKKAVAEQEEARRAARREQQRQYRARKKAEAEAARATVDGASPETTSTAPDSDQWKLIVEESARLAALEDARYQEALTPPTHAPEVAAFERSRSSDEESHNPVLQTRALGSRTLPASGAESLFAPEDRGSKRQHPVRHVVLLLLALVLAIVVVALALAAVAAVID